MSSIYRFHITKVEDRQLHVACEIVHPDVDWVEDTKNTALQIILEPFWEIKKGYIYNAAWQLSF